MKTYVGQMQRHLDTFCNPYDASLEMVLPGLQERFNGFNSMFRGFETSMQSSMQSQIRDMNSSVIHKVDVSMKRMTDTVRDDIREALHAAADAVTRRQTDEREVLGNTAHRDLHPLTQQYDTPVQTPARRRQNTTLARLPAESHTQNRQINALNTPRLSQSYASLSLMWDEWHGLGGRSTKDKPVPGGFGALEHLYKANGAST